MGQGSQICNDQKGFKMISDRCIASAIKEELGSSSERSSEIRRVNTAQAENIDETIHTREREALLRLF